MIKKSSFYSDLKKNIYLYLNQFIQVHMMTKLIHFISMFFILSLTQQAFVQAKEWYCLCYSERTNNETIQATACRSALQQCQKLEHKAKLGSEVIVADSLQVPCVKVNGEHPADDLGHKALWKPSKKEGSVWLPNACYLGEKIYQRADIHIKTNEPVAKSLTLKSGWQIKPHFNEMIGFTWLTASQENKEYSYTQFPLFEKGYADEPSCFSYDLKIESIYQKKDLAIVKLFSRCTSDGADVFSHVEMLALVLITIKKGKPLFATLWQEQAAGHRNESLGESEYGEYLIELVGTQIKVVFKETQCKNLGDKDSKCTTSSDKVVKLINLNKP